MRILHTSDWHLGAYVGPQCDDPMERMKNTVKCLDKVVEAADIETPDIILITGDLFHTAKVWSERGFIEVSLASDYIYRLSQFAPVAILYGTPNHDNMEAFRMLRETFPSNDRILFYCEPRLIKVSTLSGTLQVAGIPGFDKGYFRAQYPGLSAEDENRIFTQQLSTIVQGLSAQLDPDLPSVLMAHHTVVGSEMDNGQSIYLQNEVLLEASAIDSSAFDLVCMGHIHKAQRVESCQKPVYYAGSIDAFNFNDEGHDKGFWVYDLDSGFVYTENFIQTPARGFVTCRWNAETVKSYIESGMDTFAMYQEPLAGKVVRILYTCDSETERTLNKKKLERDLYAAGAYYVSEIRPERIHEVVNKERLTEKLTVWDCLKNYLQEKKIAGAETILDEARPIVAEVEADQPAGGQTGLFLPLEIEVRNYRSYAEQKLSFEDIYFAMINGQNGAGKSSLFMDAIVDCLYEQPREGELTGWIRAGEKSGSIGFTFQLGDDTYRVTRTRQRSGKATLAVSYKKDFPFNWEDISCQKLVDTQQKIVDILGMDADTFRSCVLIMQDQYGRFMEAKPEDRMSVLANLLGLGIYEQLEDATKKALTDVNRNLKSAKQDIADLELEVSEIPRVKAQLGEKQESYRTTDAALSLLKEECDQTSVKVVLLDQLEQNRNQLSRDMQKLNKTLDAKSRKSATLADAIQQTKTFLSNEDVINEKYGELQNLKQKFTTRDSIAQRLADKQSQAANLSHEIRQVTGQGEAAKSQVLKLKKKLDDAQDIDAQIAQVEQEAKLLPEYDAKAEKHRALQDKMSDLIKDLSVLETKIKNCSVQAQMLNSANCIDIDRASCRFLAAAKKAVAEITDLEKQQADLEKQAAVLTDEMDMLNYSQSIHSHARQASEKYQILMQRKATLDGDRQLYEVQNKELFNLHERKAQLECDLSNLNVDIDQIKAELQQFTGIQSQIEDLAGYEEQWKQLPVAHNYLDTVAVQVQDLTVEIAEITQNITDLKAKESIIAGQINDGQKYREALKQLKDNISVKESQLSNLNREIGTQEARLIELDRREDAYQEIKKQAEKLAGQASRLQLLSEAFGQDGIPHQIIRDIIPELEAHANEILSQMTGGRMRIEFRTERTLKSNKAKEIATLDIVIIDIDHGELPYLARSGGQKVRAALAVSFALAIVKASRVGLQLGMMFVDEPPYLDAEGIDAYCLALEAIHNRYPDMRIVAISHDENMKAHFPQQLFVDITDQGSRIRRIA